MNTDKIISISNLTFAWSDDSQPVLDLPAFSVDYGERVFLRGPSGSGKTTLLSLIAAVLTPQQGELAVDAVPLRSLRGGQRDRFRADRIGLVFQQFNLLPFLSVLDNILLPCQFSSARRARATEGGPNKGKQSLTEEAVRLLDAMKLPSGTQHQTVSKLSVGQQQRVAVARALIGRPPLIIADEPTTALDSDTRQAFMDLLFAEIEAAGCSLLFVSHDVSLASNFDRQVDLNDINVTAGNNQQASLS